jgi:dolichol-phosphate mannosyltransferase
MNIFKKYKITVVIPCKDEDRTIIDVIKSVKAYATEIIVVDSSFNDKVRDLICQEDVKLIFDDNKGKGHALRMGISQATGNIIIFFDADGSHRAEEITDLIKPILDGRASMVIGSRLLGYSDEYFGSLSEKMRLFGNKLITKIINIIWRANLTDSQNGFRAISKDVLEQMGLHENSFAIEQEMVIKCLKLKKKIVEIPSYELRRKYGRSKINPFIMIPRYILCLVKQIII